MNKSAAILMLVALPGCASSLVESKALQPGLAQSGRSSDLAVDATDARAPVVIAPEVLHGFAFLYEHISHTEFVLCLEGSRKQNRVFITGFRLAVMTSSTIGSVAYEPCTSTLYIGTAHNHPPVQYAADLCKSSVPDRTSFLNDVRAQVDIILCGRTRYLWVLKDGRSEVDERQPVILPVAQRR